MAVERLPVGLGIDRAAVLASIDDAGLVWRAVELDRMERPLLDRLTVIGWLVEERLRRTPGLADIHAGILTGEGFQGSVVDALVEAIAEHEKGPLPG